MLIALEFVWFNCRCTTWKNVGSKHILGGWGGLMICQFKNSPKQTIKNLKNALAAGKQREGSKPLQTESREEREVMLLFPNAM